MNQHQQMQTQTQVPPSAPVPAVAQAAQGVIESAAKAPEVYALWGASTPYDVVARATEVARVLSAVIDRQGLYVSIQSRKYVRVEGWTLLGTLVGVFPSTIWCRRLSDPDGWEARVEVRTLSGALVGASEAQCTRDEPVWRDRPSFALRSMAQTRATSKALRIPLGFVAALAGYDPTPAEEILEDVANVHHVSPAQSQVQAHAQTRAHAQNAPKPQQQQQHQHQRLVASAQEAARTAIASEAQLRRMWAAAKRLELSADEIKQIVAQRYGRDSVRQLSMAEASALIAELEAHAREDEAKQAEKVESVEKIEGKEGE